MIGSQHGKNKSKARKKGKARLVVFFVVLALILTVGGGTFAAYRFFQDRVAPGVSLGQTSLTGKTQAEVEKLVSQLKEKTIISITGTDGKKHLVSLDDLGVRVKINKTAQTAVDAKRDKSDFERFSPAALQKLTLSATTDETVMQNYLDKTFVGNSTGAQEPQVIYSQSQAKFIVRPGKSGKSVVLDSVRSAVSKALSQPGHTQKAKAQVRLMQPAISDSQAVAAAAAANARLSTIIKISNGSTKSYTIPSSLIASWMTFSSDKQTKTMTLSYDYDAVYSSLKTVLPQNLNQTLVNQQQTIDHKNRLVAVQVKGINGITVTDTSQPASQVVAALKAGRNAVITAPVQTKAYSTKSTVVYRYDIPDGDPWALVNLSEQKAYAYSGTTLKKTFNVSTGKPSTPTHPGTYTVYIKLNTQTMRGKDYVTPNVKWISYFHGGEGFHAAPWNQSGIAQGRPMSHGCVNMNPQDAKWLYDFLPMKAMVKITGSTPTKAVRG
ncbi:peptidoglycan binding domain [Scardovia inopinata]|uniref:L,D-TPase catalytic domain-containing protein n=1 Tax=Scardovia inopinata F0304 TaxID=641146 RepID=W5IJ19_SCAIO|nr:L,D-transpeptidase family protein [Scardovia inopinata]EFG27003.1 hypothetical protein HMPREF9020_00634 [Scardovia inopinata F0304]BAR06613.1 conserved hypothetical protein [Scardovia inopinata JCM 12537]SUV52139.1 peptidoglycan binding domain [Scardovia inopinata]